MPHDPEFMNDLNDPDQRSSFGGRILGQRGAIASEHYLSAQAGMDVLKAGGNAFDAAVAATLVESVVNLHMFTLGGDQQDQWTGQFFLNRVVFGMSLPKAIEAPKITCDHVPGTFYPHAAAPGQVRLEARIPQETAAELAGRGHRVYWAPAWSAGFICAVAKNDDQVLEAGADPRGNKSLAFPAAALAW